MLSVWRPTLKLWPQAMLPPKEGSEVERETEKSVSKMFFVRT